MAVSQQDAKAFLEQRRLAYLRTFLTEDADNQAVLADLALFCRAEESTFHPDPRIAAQLDGRREVYLRIMQHLKLSEEHLWRALGAPRTKGG